MDRDTIPLPSPAHPTHTIFRPRSFRPPEPPATLADAMGLFSSFGTAMARGLTRYWPAWKCVDALVSAHIQARQPIPWGRPWGLLV